MRALLDSTPSEVSSRGGVMDDHEDDDDEDSRDADSSIGSISISTSQLKKYPSISLSYKRDPSNIITLLTEDRQDEEDEFDDEEEQRDRESVEQERQAAGQSSSRWAFPSFHWTDLFPPPLAVYPVELLQYEDDEDDEEEGSSEDEQHRRKAYDDVAWAKKRAKEAMSLRHRQQQGSARHLTSSDAATPDISSLFTSTSSHSLLWRNQDETYSDWKLLIERETSGIIDSYRIHKLVVGAGKGASQRLAKDFEQQTNEAAKASSTSGGGTTLLSLKDDLADCIPTVLDWIYHPSGEAHQFDKAQFVNLMILADYLDIPSLRDYLMSQYQSNVTVDDLTNIWGTLHQSKQGAERLMVRAADSITSLVTGKVVEVMQTGNDADMNKLVEELAPVADQDLILRVMTDEAFMDPASSSPPSPPTTSGDKSTDDRSMTTRTTSNVSKRGIFGKQIRIRFSEPNQRLGRFVARFIRSNDKSTTFFDGDSVASTGASSTAAVAPFDIPQVKDASGSTAVAHNLLEQLVQLWTKKYQALQTEASSLLRQQHAGLDCGTVQEQVMEMYQQQRELLELSLQESFVKNPSLSLAALHPQISSALTRVFGSTTIAVTPATRKKAKGSSSRSIRSKKSISLRAPHFSPRARQEQEKDSKKGPQAYAL